MTVIQNPPLWMGPTLVLSVVSLIAVLYALGSQTDRRLARAALFAGAVGVFVIVAYDCGRPWWLWCGIW